MPLHKPYCGPLKKNWQLESPIPHTGHSPVSHKYQVFLIGRIYSTGKLYLWMLNPQKKSSPLWIDLWCSRPGCPRPIVLSRTSETRHSGGLCGAPPSSYTTCSWLCLHILFWIWPLPSLSSNHTTQIWLHHNSYLLTNPCTFLLLSQSSPFSTEQPRYFRHVMSWHITLLPTTHQCQLWPLRWKSPFCHALYDPQNFPLAALPPQLCTIMPWNLDSDSGTLWTASIE